MKKAAVALPLLMASLAFASKAGESFGQSMATAAGSLPLPRSWGFSSGSSISSRTMYSLLSSWRSA
jgi:hypothetical protein